MVNSASQPSRSASVAILSYLGRRCLRSKDAPKKQRTKLTDDEKKEIQTIVEDAVDDAAAGQARRTTCRSRGSRNDLLKAQGNKEYVPFTVTIDPSKMTGGKRRSTGASFRTMRPRRRSANAKKDDKDKDKAPQYAFEDLHTLDLAERADRARCASAARSRWRRATTTSSSSPRSRRRRSAKNATRPRRSRVIKQTVTVPDLWNGELSTSSVIRRRADRPAAGAAHAAAAGRAAVRARHHGNRAGASSTKLTKKAELSTFLLIYNAKMDAANKPDVTRRIQLLHEAERRREVLQQDQSAERSTRRRCRREFDLAAGHQLQSGQAVPLASFPEGDYRLEIKITDKLANKSLTRDVNFSVAGS